GYMGTVHFSSSALKAVVPVDYTFAAGDAGVHVFSAILRSAGSQSLSAMDTLDSSLFGSQVGIIVNPAATNHLVLSQFPSKTTAGVSQSFRVTAQDAFGNTTPGYTGTVAFSSTDGQAVLPANYTFSTIDAGAHTFTATFNTTGAQAITATDMASSLITGTQSGITVSPLGAATTYYTSPTGSDSNPGT